MSRIENQPAATKYAAEDSSSGYRFRLRDMLGLITLCGLQFAIIRWIGPFPGVLVGMGIVLIVFSATFLRQLYVGILETAAYRDGKTTAPPAFRPKQQRHLVFLGMSSYFMAAAALLTGGGVLINNFASEWFVRREMARKCGFQFHVISAPVTNGRPMEVIDILAITPGGAFDKAGIKKGQIIYVQDVRKFFVETLRGNLGKNVTLDIRDWKTNTTIDKTQSMQREVVIPP